jgi:hypothetical protein
MFYELNASLRHHLPKKYICPLAYVRCVLLYFQTSKAVIVANGVAEEILYSLIAVAKLPRGIVGKS